MSNEQKKPIPPLETITANSLMNTDYPPLAFSIEKLLPQGIFILAGSGKIGKSWLSLDMCIAVATGGKLWEFNACEGEVLYLALEDTHPRLKERLERIQGETESTEKLHLAILTWHYRRSNRANKGFHLCKSKHKTHCHRYLRTHSEQRAGQEHVLL